MVTLLLVASWFSYGMCDPRRRPDELAMPVMAALVRARGGMGIYAWRRSVCTTEANRVECESYSRSREDGYDPRQGMRHKTVFWTYNCQMANEERLWLWGPEFKGCFVAMQGTQRAYAIDRGERSLQKWRTDTHVIYEHKVQKTKGPQPAGVLIMALKRWRLSLNKSSSPRPRSLKAGRSQYASPGNSMISASSLSTAHSENGTSLIGTAPRSCGTG